MQQRRGRPRATSTPHDETDLSIFTIPTSTKQIKMSASLAPECNEVKESVILISDYFPSSVHPNFPQTIRQLLPEMVQRKYATFSLTITTFPDFALF